MMMLSCYTVYCITVYCILYFREIFLFITVDERFSTNAFVLVTASAQTKLDINNIQYEIKGNLNMFF